MKDKKNNNKKIDARGLSCPQPVILAKRGIEEIPRDSSLEVLLDTDTAKENVTRMAINLGCQIEVQEDAEHYILIVTKK